MYFTGKSRTPPVRFRATHSGIGFWMYSVSEDDHLTLLSKWVRQGRTGIKTEAVN
jgi:hypothetical protein